MNRCFAILIALAAVIAAPMVLRPKESARTSDYAERDRLVIITPHVETLRYELEHASPDKAAGTRFVSGLSPTASTCDFMQRSKACPSRN